MKDFWEQYQFVELRLEVQKPHVYKVQYRSIMLYGCTSLMQVHWNKFHRTFYFVWFLLFYWVLVGLDALDVAFGAWWWEANHLEFAVWFERWGEALVWNRFGNQWCPCLMLKLLVFLILQKHISCREQIVVRCPKLQVASPRYALL